MPRTEQKAKHAVIILVDAMRSYKSEIGDDRDRLDVMDELGQESIEFTNVITSAPSSVMSISAMMTGIPSYFIGLNYMDFKYNPHLFPSIPSLWRAKGYRFKSFLNSLETRTVFDKLLTPVENNFLPKGLDPYEKRWSNEEVNTVLNNYLSNNTFEKPTFFFIWFNIRLDPQTNQHLKNCIQLLKDHSIWDNSFNIVTADHGYLDPRRGFTPEKLKQMGITHDNLVTDDQIKIPFCLKLPNTPSQKIASTISTLDLLPTFVNYFHLDYPVKTAIKPTGRDLIDLIETKEHNLNEDILVRSDGRFMFQPGRVTAIRGNKYKYVYDHDAKSESFYDITTDFHEENDLTENMSEHSETLKKSFTKFKKHFQESEQEAEDFFIQITFEKFNTRVLSKIDKKTVNTMALIQFCNPRSFNLIKQICREQFPIATIDSHIYTQGNLHDNNQYDIKIALYDSSFDKKDKSLVMYYNKIIASDKFSLDINMDMVSLQDQVDPTIILSAIKREIKKVINKPSTLLNVRRYIKFLTFINPRKQ